MSEALGKDTVLCSACMGVGSHSPECTPEVRRIAQEYQNLAKMHERALQDIQVYSDVIDAVRSCHRENGLFECENCGQVWPCDTRTALGAFGEKLDRPRS